MEIAQATRSEKMSALATEMAFVKEQAQVAATERRSAVDAQARLEVALGLKEQQNQELREELAREQVLRRTAEQRVAKLNELADRLLSQNEQQARKIARRPRRRRAKTKKTTSSSESNNLGTRPKFGSRGKRVSKLSQTRQEAADRERSQARTQVRNHLSLKEQVRLANMGKDPPFMPSGNPHEEFNVYGVTQKQLSDPMAYGNVRKVGDGGGSAGAAGGGGVGSGAEAVTESRSPSGRARGGGEGGAGSGRTNARSPTLMSERSIPSPRQHSSSSSSSPQHIDARDRDGEALGGGLGAVIHAIRDEFNALTQRRNTLLQNAAESPDGHLNIDQRTIDIALADLQTKIQSKSRQLNLLEDQQRAQRELNEASLSAAAPLPPQAKKLSPSRFSPQRDAEASERKQAALDLLRHYKETTKEQEFDSLNDLHGRSLAAGWVDRDGDVISSQRRGTYFGTYSPDEVSHLREMGRTSSSLGVVHNSLRQ
jgi:hypothetical protein